MAVGHVVRVGRHAGRGHQRPATPPVRLTATAIDPADNASAWVNDASADVHGRVSQIVVAQRRRANRRRHRSTSRSATLGVTKSSCGDHRQPRAAERQSEGHPGRDGGIHHHASPTPVRRLRRCRRSAMRCRPRPPSARMTIRARWTSASRSDANPATYAAQSVGRSTPTAASLTGTTLTVGASADHVGRRGLARSWCASASPSTDQDGTRRQRRSHDDGTPRVIGPRARWVDPDPTPATTGTLTQRAE